MAQTLKRVYLYTAATFALLFTAAITIILFDTLLNVAGMVAQFVNYDGSILTSYPPPTSQQVSQIWILFLITVVLVGGLFGGLHYWLIRRDARSDPGADAGVVRHLYLNALLALAALVGVTAGLFFFGGVDQTEGSHDQALSLSFTLVAGLVLLYVYLERRRVDPAGRAAPIIRQLQEDGVQGILLIIASFIVYNSITSVIRYFLIQNNISTAFSGCVSDPNNPGVCVTPPQPLLSPILMALFAIAVWGLYVWLGHWSRGAVLKRVLWYAALGYGLIWLLIGIEQAADTGFAAWFGYASAWPQALYNALPFVGEVLVGTLITVPYVLWLRRLAARAPTLREPIQQGLLALAAALSIGFFLAGIILVLIAALDQIVPGAPAAGAIGWATAVGILIAGILYPYFWVRLRSRSNPALGGPTAPRRAFVLVVLAATAIGALIGAVFLAYQLLASLLGLPGASPESTRESAVVFVVLGVTALYHLWQLRADLRVLHARALAVPSERAEPASLSEPPAEPLSAPDTLEAILERVSAGSLDPTSAALRIRSLPKL